MHGCACTHAAREVAWVHGCARTQSAWEVAWVHGCASTHAVWKVAWVHGCACTHAAWEGAWVHGCASKHAAWEVGEQMRGFESMSGFCESMCARPVCGLGRVQGDCMHGDRHACCLGGCVPCLKVRKLLEAWELLVAYACLTISLFFQPYHNGHFTHCAGPGRCVSRVDWPLCIH